MKPFRLYVVGLIVHILPPTKFWGIKRVLYRWAGATIGRGVCINSSVSIIGHGNLVIGDNTWIGPETLIVCSACVEIGKNCDIAPRCYIGTGTHLIASDSNKSAGVGVSYPIKIEDGCWLCVNSTILPGTLIGQKSIIAAGAVVKGTVPSNEIWGGVIAKYIKNI